MSRKGQPRRRTRERCYQIVGTACGNGTNVWTPEDADPALAEGIEDCEQDLTE